MKKNPIYVFLFVYFASMLFVPACNQQVEQPIDGDKLKVVATTTIVGDVVSQVGSDLIELSVLLPVGTDPHSFDPNPQDIAKVSEADVIFANGAGLEDFLDKLIESAGAEERVASLSEGIQLMDFEGAHEGEHEGEEDTHAGGNPHTWTDPNNVIVWVRYIEQLLSELDPVHAEAYQANAEKYQDALEELDAWIREQAARIPEGNRAIVTDHLIYGYFTERYGFEQLGAIIPGYSTLSEPSAQELAEMEDVIMRLGVRAIFVGNTVNPSLAERIAEDTGVQLVYLYTGSLSQPGGEADTYIKYMHYNTTAFVDALTPNP
ncbi:MAG: zinc ABC transporter substrate-binding protein [Anaerolineales bacterium]|nr:zinc ABC transporter substrate-binding protein [Anaerolineales bacterium]